MEQIAINILPKGAKPVCHSSQFDDGRQIRFNLFNDKTPYTLSGTETISVLVHKPDGAEVVDSVTNTSDSYVVWEVSTDACELSGVCECELSIVENGIVLGSKNFTMKVEEDAYNGKTIEVRTASGRIATFSTNMVEAFKSLKSDINPVQSGTGTPSPQNVRPISGFSALNVTRTGVNLWDEEWEVGGISDMTGEKAASANVIRSKNYIKVEPLMELYSSAVTRKYYYDKDFNYIGHSTNTDGLFTIPNNCYYLLIRSNANYGTIYLNDISINYPSTDTDYHAYNGQTVTVNFGQTVYGGVADVTNGKLKITHKLLSIDNNSALYSSGNSAYLNISDAKIVNEYASAISDKYEYNTWSGAANGDNGYFTLYQNTAWSTARLAFNRNGLSLADFITSLTNNPIEVVYELATPIEITTTPENLSALSGQNNVYGDTNGDTEVEYYIEV